MSLTIENLEAQIGRRLKKGDILISRRVSGEPVLHDVIEPFVRTEDKERSLEYRTRGPAVKIVEITTFGPVSTDVEVMERGWNGLYGLIKVEDRLGK